MRTILFGIFFLAVSSQYIEASAPFPEDFEKDWTTNWWTEDVDPDYGLDFWGANSKQSHNGSYSAHCASSVSCFGENTTVENIPDKEAQKALSVYIAFSDIPTDATILKVDVCFSITHERPTDLTVSLWSPDEKKGVNLNQNDYNDIKTISNINNFNGTGNINGKWRLEIYDTAKDIAGTFNSCWIKIYYSSVSSAKYDGDMKSYLIAKEPLDLSTYSNPPALSFWYWLKTYTITDINNNWNDWLGVWGGRWVNNCWEDQKILWCKSEDVGTWKQAFVDLDEYAGKSDVHLGFWFESDVMFQKEGAYIDDVSIVTQPDLIVIDISVDSPANVQVPKIHFEIRNEGSTIKDYVSIKVYVDESLVWTGGRTAIIAGGYANGEFEHPFFNGNHIVKIEVDPDKNISESNENNNVRIYSFNWTGLPDLKITDVSVTPSSPIGSESTKIGFILKNEGIANAGNHSISLFLNDVQQETLLFTGVLQPGQTIAGTFTISPSQGTYEIKIVADSENKITESNETNNSSTKTIFWQWPLLYDLRIEPSAFYPYDNGGKFTTGSITTISYKLSKPATVTITIFNFREVAVRTLIFEKLRQIGPQTENWSGIIDDTDFGIFVAPDDSYTIEVKAEDPQRKLPMVREKRTVGVMSNCNEIK